MSFSISRPDKQSDLLIELALPGKHNVLNAAAAIAIATHLGVDDKSIQQGLKAFEGIGRRFQILGDVLVEAKKITIVDDYAHHPVELEATLTAATDCWPERRLVVIFQPHRYSRTFDLFDNFVQVLSQQADLFVCEVYAAGETPISGASGGALCQAIRVRGASNPIFVPSVDEIEATLTPLLQDGDVVLTMGAGSIGKASQNLYASLSAGVQP